MVSNTKYFSEAGFYDRVVVQEIIKEMAQTRQINPQTQRPFKGYFIFFFFLSCGFIYFILFYFFRSKLFLGEKSGWEVWTKFN